MSPRTKHAIWSLMAVMASALPATAQGVELERGAVVYFGTASRTTAPATIDYEAVRDETPEWQTIVSEGIRKGSGRYRLLVTKMDKRIRASARAAASANSHDLVVRDGDIADARGKSIDDLTQEVIDGLDKELEEVEELVALESDPPSA